MGRRQKHRRFSPEFKAEAVRLVRETDTSLSEIARELGVSATSLQKWADAVRPQPRTPLTEDERSELQRLQREIRRVTTERDILKNESRAWIRPTCGPETPRRTLGRPGLWPSAFW